jgi:hypothetical protein
VSSALSRPELSTPNPGIGLTAEDRDSWLELQRKREERMRYEVLNLISTSVGGQPEVEKNVSSFIHQLGTWHAELFRVVEWLDRQGFIRYCGAGPTVCLTPRGVAFLDSAAGRRRSIRDSDLG